MSVNIKKEIKKYEHEGGDLDNSASFQYHGGHQDKEAQLPREMSTEQRSTPHNRKSLSDELKIGYDRGTIFGGCLTLIGAVLVFGGIIHNLVLIYATHEHKYTMD